MTKMKWVVVAIALATALAAIPGAQAAPTVHYVAAGSSAMYQGFGVALVNDLLATHPTVTGGGSIHHYTFNSACPGTCVSVLHDPRTNSSIGPIPDEPAKVWVVYVCTTGPNALVYTPCAANTSTDVWVYMQVDSTVGVRSIMSRPNVVTGKAAVLARLDTSVQTSVAATNQISPTLFAPTAGQGGTPSWGAGDTSCTPAGAITCDDEFLPGDVWTALGGATGIAVNVGATDIRPEDAKYATKRANGPISNGSSLGYGTIGSQLVGAAIQSAFSNTIATPVEFGLIGSVDPITSSPVPGTLNIFPVGESPIVVITNRSNVTGLGAPDGAGNPAFSDIEDDNGTAINRLSTLFSGTTCNGSNSGLMNIGATQQSLTAAGVANFPLTIVQRESLSGTFNTFEFTEVRTHGTWNLATVGGFGPGSGAQGGSQEFAVNPTAANNNPLNLACQGSLAGATRKRAIGTGELVKQVSTIADSIGYTFFSFGNVKSLSNSNSFGYLTIDNVDPLFVDYACGTNENGQPACNHVPLACAGGVNCQAGTLPACTAGTNCNTGAVWTAASGSFPHLRDGSYRAWSLLRQICDTTDGHCISSADGYGAQAIINAASTDIHNNTATSVADYLPVQDIAFIRSHFYFKQFSGTEHSIPFVHWVDDPSTTLDIPGTAGELAGTVPPAFQTYAQGGDAGGCIQSLATNNTVVHITQATQVGGNTKYNYTVTAGNPLVVGQQIGVYGMTAAGNNGNFSIVSFPVAGQFKVANAAGSNEVPGANAYGVNGPVNCFQ